jgi:8-oxo-dGTP pyrophosphatase MutT (NUDIX family)
MPFAQSRPALVESLQRRLLLGNLPGEAAHFRMAHPVRKAEVSPDPVTTRDAAVMIILFEKGPDDWHVLFIRRAAIHDQDKHAGQIAFPGGKKDKTDRDLMYTALRETEEEVAINIAALDVLGQLTPLYITVSKFLVHPFVAWSSVMPKYNRHEAEVEEILELPLTAFRDPEVLQEMRIRIHPGIILNHVPSYHIDGHTIWGATAMIMSELLALLDADSPS